jgi:hypothetical protein
LPAKGIIVHVTAPILWEKNNKTLIILLFIFFLGNNSKDREIKIAIDVS